MRDSEHYRYRLLNTMNSFKDIAYQILKEAGAGVKLGCWIPAPRFHGDKFTGMTETRNSGWLIVLYVEELRCMKVK